LTCSFHLFSRVAAVLLICAAPCASGAAQPVASNSIPLGTFVLEMDRLIAEIESAGSPAAVGGIPERWVVDAGDQRIDVSARWLREALAVQPGKSGPWAPMRKAIVGRLAGVREQAAALASSPGNDRRADARASVPSILSREEFRQSAASRWREQLQRRLGEWLEDLWSRLGGGPGGGQRIATGLAWAGALAALVGLGVFLARSLSNRSRAATLNLGRGAGAAPRARELALRALAAARAGNSREAVRFAYNAALTKLEEQGAWRIDAARTPREYLPMLRASDSRHPVMLDLTQRFERIWYANRAAAPDEMASVTAHLEALECLRPGERAI
jgi:hypothetical protein